MWYKLRWIGFNAAYDTWEPRSNLGGLDNILKAWEETYAFQETYFLLIILTFFRTGRKRPLPEDDAPFSKKVKNSKGEAAEPHKPFTIWDLLAGKEPPFLLLGGENTVRYASSLNLEISTH